MTPQQFFFQCFPIAYHPPFFSFSLVTQVPRSAPGRLHSGAAVQLVGVAVPVENRLEAGSDLGR